MQPAFANNLANPLAVHPMGAPARSPGSLSTCGRRLAEAQGPVRLLGSTFNPIFETQNSLADAIAYYLSRLEGTGIRHQVE